MSDDKTPATTNAVQGNAVTLRPADRFRAYMAQRAAAESAQSGEDVAANQIGKIVEAETADDIFDAVAGGTIQARDVVGLEVEIQSMRMQESDRYEGSPYYANLDVSVIGGPVEVLRRADLQVGATAVLQTGAEIIIAQVRQAEAKGLLPLRAVIAGSETSSGFTVLKLGRMPERSTPTTATK